MFEKQEFKLKQIIEFLDEILTKTRHKNEILHVKFTKIKDQFSV